MHPNQAFHWQDRDAIRAFVEEVGFGTLFAATPDGPRVVHVPMVWDGPDALAFHIARGNALARHLEGISALFVVNGPDAYVSPDWYKAGPNEVPTWNYVAAELEGQVRRLDREALIAQIDRLTAREEARLNKQPWTRAKMEHRRFDAMLDAIIGFRLDIQAWRGTIKLNQNKPEAARLAAANTLEQHGRRAISHWMRTLP
ncbi:FMN-binding negative transcriptional regulator [Stakelama sediminis]|uniref:Transcriptional regulator n=1 Tax=Stakelama sediminis TaxID=463200 RepID=A0A840Z027_9SPHN|nr:transcriptional regulator [Stakelama sediminis]